MIVGKIFINNFASFYGKHILQLEEGVNFVAGPGGSGKTNLARAFMFAVLGYSDIPKKCLINIEHSRECSEKSKNPFCQVEVDIRYKDRDYHVQSSLSLIEEKELIQSTKIDPDIDEIITPQTYKYIYLNPLNLELENTDESTATRTIRSVIKHLSLNVKSGIKMAILDGVLESLTVGYTEKLLSLINELGLEQLTIMVKYLDRIPRNLDDRSVKIHF